MSTPAFSRSVLHHATRLAFASSLALTSACATEVGGSASDSRDQASALAAGAESERPVHPMGDATPTITGYDPSIGSNHGGTVIHIFGTNFDTTGKTLFMFEQGPGQATAYVQSCPSSTECIVTTPAGNRAQPVTPIVNQVYGPPGPLFEFGPSVTGLSESVGAVGDVVTVDGYGFAQGQTDVFFGSAAATVVSCTATSCDVIAPSNYPGASVSVTVTVAGVEDWAEPGTLFTYAQPVCGVIPHCPSGFAWNAGECRCQAVGRTGGGTIHPW